MKMAFFITSNLYVRNFIHSGVYNDLINKHDIDCFLTNDVSLKLDLKTYKFIIPKNFRRLSAFVNDLRTIKFRDLTKSFFYRFQRQKQSSKKSISEFILFYIKFIIARIHFIYIFFEKIIRFYPVLSIHSELIKDYDLVVIPNSGFDSDFDYIIKLLKANSVLSYMLVDNWDNLSSKSIMLFKPNYLAVMSEQCYNHAIKIQGIRKDKIHIIGNSRFEIYKNIPKTIFNFNYILFAGCNLPYNEINALKLISKSIEEKNLKIIYRPHPWRQKREDERFDELKKLSNVIIDPQISSAFNQIGDLNFQPSLNYYNDLVKNSKYVISPLSTLVLESLICKKPVVVLIEDEIDNFTSPYKVYKNYKHFEDIESIPNCYLLKNLNNFSSLHSRLCVDQNYVVDKNSHGLDYHILFDEKKYVDHLLESFDKIYKKIY